MDLHLHSTFSDGLFSPGRIVEHAVETGIQSIGFSDHYNTVKTKSIQPDELVKYIEQLTTLQHQYDGNLKIYKAIEIDGFQVFRPDFELPSEDIMKQLDYVLVEYVANPPLPGLPLTMFFDFRRQIPIPTGMAHTDLLHAFNLVPPRTLIDFLESQNIFIELNQSYMRPGEKHPFYLYWEPYFRAAYNRSVFFSVGSDMHNNLTDLGASHALAIIESFGLTEQLLFPATNHSEQAQTEQTHQ